MQPPLFQLAMTWLLNISFAVTVGALAAMLWLPQPQPQPQPQIHDTADASCGQRLRAAVAIGLALCAVSTLLSLWQACATMADVTLAECGPSMWGMFATTHYGQLGLASLGLLLAAGIGHFFYGKESSPRVYIVSMLLAIALYAVCRVGIGHAAQSGFFSVAAAVEWLHMLMMALWVGAVILAGWIVLPIAANRSAPATSTGAYMVALSHWATVALAAIVATGLFNTYRVLASPQELIRTPYGWVLTAKISLVLLAIGMGGWNRFVGFPAVLNSTRGPHIAGSPLRTVIAILRVESVVLLLVLAAAAILTSTAPAGAS